jgi:hypothetical protein
MIVHHLEFANAWLLFLALFALYSPIAALSSYASEAPTSTRSPRPAPQPAQRA